MWLTAKNATAISDTKESKYNKETIPIKLLFNYITDCKKATVTSDMKKSGIINPKYLPNFCSTVL
jgi:hypothetical protein